MSYDNDQELQEIIKTIKQGIENNKINRLYPYNDELSIKVTIGHFGSVSGGIRHESHKTYGILVRRLNDNTINHKCKEIQEYIKQKIKS